MEMSFLELLENGNFCEIIVFREDLQAWVVMDPNASVWIDVANRKNDVVLMVYFTHNIKTQRTAPLVGSKLENNCAIPLV